MWTRVVFAMAVGILWARAADEATSPAWITLENCRFVEGPHSDGDSVEAEHDGQRHVFRLYFIDTIEKNPQSKARRAGQAKYFDLTGEDAEGRALQSAYAAADFTRDQLRLPFTVRTKGVRVDSEESNPSVRAFITTAEGKDLASELVRQGLAIIRSGKKSVTDPPDGRSADAVLRDLRELETDAHLAGRGAWAFARLAPEPAVPADRTVEATDTAGLQSQAGHRARVRGKVRRVNALPDGRITFVDFEGVERGGFVVIVRAASLPAVQQAFSGDLGKFLTGREITVEGLVTLYRDTPQIEVESPAQIRIPSEAAP